MSGWREGRGHCLSVLPFEGLDKRLRHDLRPPFLDRARPFTHVRLMSRRYGTPLPPLARRPLIPRPHLPKGKVAWQASLRRGGTWARIVLVVGLLAVFGSILGAATATPARPHLNLQGEPIILGTVVVERPLGWALAAETPDLTRPIVIFAPQPEDKTPPVSITIYAVDATAGYEAALSDATATGSAPSDYDLLVSLVTGYCEQAKIPTPAMTRNTYNTTLTSSIVRVDLIATWPSPFPWKPAEVGDIVETSPTPIPTLGAGVTPTPEPVETTRPLSYPDLGSPVPGQDMVVVEAYYLPDGNFFSGTGQDGKLFRKMVVMTLSYPASLDPEVAAEARVTFDRVASSISFGS